jgi:hypothetical protein
VNRKASGSFLKKRTKKLMRPGAWALHAPGSEGVKVFARFFQKALLK